MDNNLFRKKNLDKVSSPENLDSFLRVTNPSMWMAFAAIIIILAGALVWCFIGTIESKTNGVIVSNEKGTTCYVSEKHITDIKPGMKVRVGADEYTITEISPNSVLDNKVLTDYAMQLGGFQNGEYVYPLEIDEKLDQGNYKCEIVLEEIRPIDLLS